MSTVTYPSKTFPGFPEAGMNCPEGLPAVRAIQDSVELADR